MMFFPKDAKLCSKKHFKQPSLKQQINQLELQFQREKEIGVGGKGGDEGGERSIAGFVESSLEQSKKSLKVFIHGLA